MTITAARFTDAENRTMAATIDGTDYGGITPESRFWQAIQEWAAAGNVIAPYAPPARTADDVNAERDRRLTAGFDYDFGDARGVHRIGTTAADMIGWRDVTDYAEALVATGDTATTIAILTDTGPAHVTGGEWLAILKAAAAARQPLWQASFALAAMNPIPADYADHAHWR